MVRPTVRLVWIVVLVGVIAATASARARAAEAIPASFPAAGHLRVATLVVRARPDSASAAVRVFREFRGDYRPQVVLAVAAKTGRDGRPWLKLQVPMRPNGRVGWVPAAAVDVRPVHTRVVVHRGARRLDLFERGRRVYTTRVAVGAPGMETPVGHFYVTARFVPEDGFLGSFAFETSAYSKLSEWPGGGVVGLHGTSMPWLLGRAVSHGCVRISNTAALALKRYVLLGTPIDIVSA